MANLHIRWWICKLVNCEKTHPLADMFFGFEITFIFQDSIPLFKGPIEGLFENAPKLF
jgi:hypothetical protein